MGWKGGGKCLNVSPRLFFDPEFHMRDVLNFSSVLNEKRWKNLKAKQWDKPFKIFSGSQFLKNVSEEQVTSVHILLKDRG